MGFESMPMPGKNQEAIKKCEEEAKGIFESMDIKMLEKFAKGTETENEYMDNGPTTTEGFGEAEVRKMANNIFEKRKESEKGEGN